MMAVRFFQRIKRCLGEPVIKTHLTEVTGRLDDARGKPNEP